MVPKSAIRFVLSVGVAVTCGLSGAVPLRAQELSILGGVGRASAPSESSYAWGFTYLQALDHYNALSYSWINEGHFTSHHRDGFALQYWRRAWFFDQRLALAAGIGKVVHIAEGTSQPPRRASNTSNAQPTRPDHVATSTAILAIVLLPMATIRGRVQRERKGGPPRSVGRNRRVCASHGRGNFSVDRHIADQVAVALTSVTSYDELGATMPPER